MTASLVRIPLVSIELRQRMRPEGYSAAAIECAESVEGQVAVFDVDSECYQQVLHTPMPKLVNAAVGAAKMAKAAAMRNYAPDDVQQQRAQTCASCESVVRKGTVYSCGPLLADNRAAGKPTCGCGVARVTVGGYGVVPSGKTKIASDRCPQGRWAAVNKAGTA